MITAKLALPGSQSLPFCQPWPARKFAVDFDGNGRRDLLRSPQDVLASTANFLAGHGWQKGKDWEPGSANFAVIKEWNKSEVYAKTIGYFATQLSRAP